MSLPNNLFPFPASDPFTFDLRFPGRTADGAAGAGAAYLYNPATGALVQTFRNPTPQAGDSFGTAVVAVGGSVVVGAPGDDTAGLDAGAAYVIEAGTAQAVRTITNPNGASAGSGFGSVLAATGLRVAVGAPLDDSAGTDAGGVYAYELDPSSSAFGSFRNPNASPTFSKFGSAVASSGNRLLVGAVANGSTSTAFTGSGSAFLFDADSGSATFGTSLKSFKRTVPVASDRFGAAVAFVGDDAAIGATGDDTGATDAGLVHRFAATAVYTVSASSIVENGTVTASGSFADAGTGDAHTAVIDWADGATTTIALPAGTYGFSAGKAYEADLAIVTSRVGTYLP